VVIDTSGSASLVVVWRSGKSSHGRVVKAGGEVIAALRHYAETAATVLDSHYADTLAPGRRYDPDQEQDDAPFLRLDTEDLLDSTIIEQLRQGASLPTIDSNELRTKRLALYALLIGDDPDARSAFIRASSPLSLTTKGLVALFDQTLTRVVAPVFAFDETFDVVIGQDGAWALNQANFERLFRESAPVLAKTNEWVKSLATLLPIAESGQELLAERLRQNSALRRKVRSLISKPYLPTLTMDRVAEKATAHGLDAASLIHDGELVFTRDVERELVHLLNEDLFEGDFSGSPYAAGRKTVRGLDACPASGHQLTRDADQGPAGS
jgi:hypothetical protein